MQSDLSIVIDEGKGYENDNLIVLKDKEEDSNDVII